VGYAGGRKGNPTYHSLGDHSEAIQIDYDPEKVSYEELLRVFWGGHDPGSQSWSRQYRNILFYHDPKQKELALKSRERLEAKTGRRVATDIVPYESFHQAEDYHQKHALQRYPDLMEEFRAMYPVFTDFVNSTAAARVNGYLAGYGSCQTLRQDIDMLGLSEAASHFVLEAACGRTARPLECPIPGR
jgi:peptide-methionine (S)-S-oxide reductase